MGIGQASIVGIEPVHGTGTGLFLTSPSPSGTGLVQAACLSHVPVPNLSHWDKHSACPKHVPLGQALFLLAGAFLI